MILLSLGLLLLFHGKPRASGDDPMYVNDAIGFRM